MWRPRGELQEALAVAVVSTGLALALLQLFAPRALEDVLPRRRPPVGELAAREDLASLARAQSRYYATHGRYAYDLASLPWQSGFGIFVRVREADATGYRVTARAGRRPRMECELRVQRAATGARADSTVIACRRRDS